MKSTAKPIRSTIIWGLISGLLYIPLCIGLSRFMLWPVSFQVSLWMLLAGYGVLLSRWTPKSLRSVSFPLLLLFFAAFFIRSTGAFLFASLVMLSWIRSDICFKEKPFLKRWGAEIGLGLAAGLLVSGAVPAVAITWALGIWLFFLIQALYFVLFDYQGDAEVEIEADPFEKAKMEAQKIFSNGI
ncbi:MAG: hypothetical protein PVI82_14475 [Desulfobacterales bacterium]|jgi:hypothetical protein